jgi:hypothetical protein
MADRTERGCAWLHEVGAELALGLLDAEDRSAALAHLNRCPECRIRVTQYAQVGDGLLGLLPGAEPPVGFEDRVMARLAASPAPAPADDDVVPLARKKPRRWVPIAVAAALAAVVCGLGGWALGSTGATPAAPAVAAPAELAHGTLLTSARHADGEVWVYTGKQPWLYMYVTDMNTQRVSCQLTKADGGIVDVGSFQLNDGSGYWGAPAEVDPKQVTGARIVDDHGAVLASAAFN